MYVYIIIYASKRNPARMDLRIEGTQVTTWDGAIAEYGGFDFMTLPQV